VITQDNIRRSGATSIPEVLRRINFAFTYPICELITGPGLVKQARLNLEDEQL
jgi:hypothetical protein